MQSEKRYPGRKRDYHERKRRNKEKGDDRHLSEMRNQDVSDYGQILMLNVSGRFQALRPKLLTLGVLLSLNIFALVAVYDLSRPQLLEVVFFDIGQGDSIFIETPQGHQILIDGGPDSTILKKLGEEMPFWDRAIDLIILTHPSADHLNGLLMVLERYQVNQILWSGIEVDTFGYQQWMKLIAEENADIFIARSGQKIKMGKNVYLDILHPAENLKGQKIKGRKAINNTSIVSRLVFGQNSFLFTADIEKRAEQELINRGVYLNSAVLKVAHQGSKTSSSEEFLAAVSPEIAIISVGKDNRYGHPHQETLEILEKYDIKILRTDLDGDIRIISDGKNYEPR